MSLEIMDSQQSPLTQAEKKSTRTTAILALVGIALVAGLIAVGATRHGVDIPSVAIDPLTDFSGHQHHCRRQSLDKLAKFYEKCTKNYSPGSCLTRVTQLESLLCPPQNCKAQYKQIVPRYISCQKQASDPTQCYKTAQFDMQVACSNQQQQDHKDKKDKQHHQKQQGEQPSCLKQHSKNIGQFYQDCLGNHGSGACMRRVRELRVLLCPKRCRQQYSVIVPHYKACINNHGFRSCFHKALNEMSAVCGSGSNHQGEQDHEDSQDHQQQQQQNQGPSGLYRSGDHAKCAKNHAKEIGTFYTDCLGNHGSGACMRRVEELKDILCPNMHCSAQYETIVPHYKSCINNHGFRSCYHKAVNELRAACGHHGESS